MDTEKCEKCLELISTSHSWAHGLSPENKKRIAILKYYDCAAAEGYSVYINGSQFSFEETIEKAIEKAMSKVLVLVNEKLKTVSKEKKTGISFIKSTLMNSSVVETQDSVKSALTELQND